ncbi:MAG: hypothetical protein GX567_08185 [Clostridia bacterium]|nr:hypothetical protein [Clostridia bacterium]
MGNEKDKSLNAVSPSYQKLLIIVPVLIVLALTVWFLLQPEKSINLLNSINETFVGSISWLFLVLPLAVLGVSFWWALSKRGKIKMGGSDAKPKYPLWLYIGMIVCAGLAAGSCIFSLVEWSLYVNDPPFNIEPNSIEAAEWATSTNLFNWGLTVCGLNMLLVLPFCYTYYVRKRSVLRLGDVAAIMVGEDKPYAKTVRVVCNLIYIIVVLGGLCCTLGLGVPNISMGLSNLFGFEATNLVNVIVIIVIAIIFSFSSSLGIKKGLSRLTSFNVFWALAFLFVILLNNPVWILDNTLRGIGMMADNFMGYCFNTDTVYQGGFGSRWTLFFYAYAWAFAAMLSVLVVKISYGRTFRQMIFSVIFGMTGGCWLLMGINGSFGLKLFLDGKVNLPEIVASEGNNAGIYAILSNSNMGETIGTVAFLIMIILFLSTSLDSASLSLAAATQREVSIDAEPAPKVRLMWCLILAAIPLAMIAAGGNLSSLQAFVNLVCWPVLIVGLWMWYKIIKWSKEDGY